MSRATAKSLVLAGACALALIAPRDARAGKGVTGSGTVQPAPDPWIYDIQFSFSPATNEYFHAGDYFTLTGFGSFISLSDLHFNDTHFSLTGASAGSDTLTFNYNGPDQFNSETIGTITFDATTLNLAPPITYHDHILVDNKPATNPDTGPNSVVLTPVPEPSAIALLGLGAAGGLVFRRRMARRRA